MIEHPTPQNARKGKRIIRVAQMLLLAVLVAGGGWLVMFVKSERDHTQRILAARKAINAYTQTQWAHLYEGVQALVSRNPGPMSMGFAQEQWPAEVVALNPYNLMSWDDEVSMNWTGGFDEQTLSLHVILQPGHYDQRIYVIDSTRGDTDHWYVYRVPPGK